MCMNVVAGTLEEVSAVLGRGTELPCNIEPTGKEDRVYMVLWFREGAGKPLYRLVPLPLPKLNVQKYM